jgi:hypothetical protein
MLDITRLKSHLFLEFRIVDCSSQTDHDNLYVLLIDDHHIPNVHFTKTFDFILSEIFR